MNREDKLQKRVSNTLTNAVKDSDDESELKQSYIDFLSQTRKKQREADWEMQDAYGKTNKERYEELQSELLKKDIDDDDELVYDGTGVTGFAVEVSESGTTIKEQVEDDKVKFSDINYPPEAVEVALQWSHSAMRTVIIPTNKLEDLEDLWINYRSMIRKHQRESDWKSEELFGVNNQTHYEYLKSKLLKADIDDGDNTIIEPSDSGLSPVENECALITKIKNPLIVAEKCLGLYSNPNKTYFEEVLLKDYIDDTIKYFDSNIAVSTDLPLDDLPFFDPEEMMDLGVYGYDKNYYDIDADNDELSPGITTEQWFKNYKMVFNGVMDENTIKYSKLRINKLRELYLGLDDIKESGDIAKLNARKQSILELGWDPDIDFTVENRLKANTRIKTILKEKCNLKILNCANVTDSLDENGAIQEGKIKFVDDKGNLVPEECPKCGSKVGVFLRGEPVFLCTNKKCNKYFGVVPARSARTNESVEFKNPNERPEFVYIVALNDGGKLVLGFSYDSSLKELYKYEASMPLGISKYSINNYDKNTFIQVYGVVIREKDLVSLRESIKYYMENNEYIIDKIDLFSFIDNGIIISNFICKLLQKEADRSPKFIYKLYDGKIGEYNYGKLNSYMAALLSNNALSESYSVVDKSEFLEEAYGNWDNLVVLKTVFESNMEVLNNTEQKIYNGLIKPFTELHYFTETKEFPIQFDSDGNLLIKSIKKINFRTEYGKSHRLLLQYEKVENLEGIKYEISKLYFLNNLLERKIYVKQVQKDRSELFKVRAFILNDFNKYLSFILEREKSFNFTKYFEKSPFSDAIYKINGSTLKYSIDAIKGLFSK